MKIITYQAKEVIDILNGSSEYKVTSPNQMKTYNSFQWKYDSFNPFKEVYDYISDRMKKNINSADFDDEIIAPIWGWYKYKSIRKLNNDNKDLYRIELEIEDDKVLLSDFYIYEDIAVAGPGALIEDEEELEEFYKLEKLKGKEETYRLYDQMLDVSKAQYVQATFWKIKKENIISITKVRK